STEQVKSLTEKEAKEIYQSDYWVQSGGDIFPVGIDYMAFDYSVHSGATQAVKSLQRVVGQALDAIVNTKTINAVKSYKGDLFRLRSRAITLYAYSQVVEELWSGLEKAC